MNDKLMMLEFLKHNPTASNEDIARFIGVNINNAKNIISRLKKSKILKITTTTNGDRFIKVLSEEIYKKQQNKIDVSNEEKVANKTMLKKLAEKVLDATINEKDTDKIVSAGNLFIRIYDRL